MNWWPTVLQRDLGGQKYAKLVRQGLVKPTWKKVYRFWQWQWICIDAILDISGKGFLIREMMGDS